MCLCTSRSYITVSKEGSKSQGMPAKETTHTAITCTMKAFLTAHGRQLDPALPDGNCLFHALSKQMTGESPVICLDN